VFQLPSRKGEARFIEALCTGDDTKGGWRDMGEKGSALVFPNAIHRCKVTGEDDPRELDAAIDAARGADREAELFAEREREYQEAYQAGARAADLANDAIQARDEAKALRADLRSLRDMGHNAPAKICENVAASISAYVRTARSSAEESRELRERFALGKYSSERDKHLADAFKEGLGE
jgi:hypothetical protein